ncbi:MAG: hypothetical protein M0D55_08695 [Elusimicrobiota bacterium]|nr:MAG: hypothetical protein M0D55_08695 [Elusimicrobiota bacterium]
MAAPGEPRREARVPLCASPAGRVYWVRAEPSELHETDAATGASRRVASADGFTYLLAYDPRADEVVSFLPGSAGAPGRLVFVGTDGRVRHARVEEAGSTRPTFPSCRAARCSGAKPRR